MGIETGGVNKTNNAIRSLLSRQFDTREPHTCRGDTKVLLVGLQKHMGPNAEAKSIAINPRRPEQLAVGANDVYVRLYDRRMISLGKVTRFLLFIGLH